MNHTQRPAIPTLAQAGETLPHPGFWQTRTAQDVLPFVTSLVLHLLIIMLGILLVPRIVQNLTPDHSQPQVEIASTGLDINSAIGDVKFPGITDNSTRPPTQDKDPNLNDLHGVLDHRTTEMDFSLGSTGGDNTLIAIGPGKKTGIGPGDGDPFGTGPGGPAKFGVNSGGQGPIFVHPATSAKSVVFVCDGTGSMMWGDRRDILRNELKREISRMKPVQSFNILFYQKDATHGYTAFQSTLMPANMANQSKVEAWLTPVLFCADPDPRTALDEAFREAPQLIYFLTGGTFSYRGGGPTDADMLVYFQLKNTAHKTQVNTVLFLPNHQDAELDAVTKTLKTVAKENGGAFKLVYADDL